MTPAPTSQPSRTRRRPYGVACVLPLALLAAAGFWWWMQPPWPRTTWDAGTPAVGLLPPDGRMLLGQYQAVTRTRISERIEEGKGMVRLWDTHAGVERLQVPGVVSGVSADGRWLAVWDWQRGLGVWDVTTGKLHATLTAPAEDPEQASRFPSVRFSPDSRLLAHDRPGGTGVVLWDLGTGQPQVELEGARKPFVFSPDGRTLAAAARDNTGALWDVATGDVRARLDGFTEPIEYLAFSPDGSLLATQHFAPSAQRLTEVRLWRVSDGGLRARLPCSASGDGLVYFRPPTFSPDSRWLIVSSTATQSPLWNVSTDPPTSLGHLFVREEPDPTTGGTRVIRGCPIFSPDGRWLIGPGPLPGSLTVQDAVTLAPRSVVNLNGQRCGSPVFSPDGRTMAVDVSYNEPVHQVRPGGPGLLDRLFPSGSVSQRPVQAVRLFDVATGRELGQVPGRLCGSFTPDSRSLFTVVNGEGSSGPPPVVHRWDLPLGRPLVLYGSLLALVLALVAACWWLWCSWPRRPERNSPSPALRPGTEA